MIQCKICKKEMKLLGYTHLKLHDITAKEYKLKYPGSKFEDDDVKFARQKTCREKYGIDNPLKFKSTRDAMKKSMNSKYGANSFFESKEGKKVIKKMNSSGISGITCQKAKNTIKEKYGVEYASQNNDVKLLIKKSCQEKYEVDNISQSNEIINRKKTTLMKHYGVDSYAKTQEFKDRMRELFKDRYGIDTDTAFNIPELKLKALNNSQFPKAEHLLIKFFDENNIKYVHNYEIKFGISYKYYDFYLPEYNLLIEHDGDFWHQLPQQKINDKQKNTLAKNNGYRLVRIKELEFGIKWNIII